MVDKLRKSFVLGNNAAPSSGWSVGELMEALSSKFAPPSVMSGESEKAIQQSEELLTTPIRFPYGLNPSQLSELLYVEPTHRACCMLKARALMTNSYNFVHVDGRPDPPPDSLRRFFHQLFPSGPEQIIYPCALDFEAVGNAYIEIVRKADERFVGGEGRIGRLVHVPAFTVRRLPAGHPTGCQYVQEYGEQKVYFREFGVPEPRSLPKYNQPRVNELIHVKNIGGQSHSNYWYGLPDIVAALPALLGIQRAMEYISGYLAAKGAPNYFLFLRGAGADESVVDQATLNRYFNEALERGPGRVVVMSLPPDVEDNLRPLSLEANPMEVVRFIHECRDQIARAHGVPLRLLSILEAGQLGGTGEAQAQLEYFKQFVIRPRQNLWAGILYETIVANNPNWADWRIRFGELSIEDTLRTAQADTLRVRFGVQTINEVRAANGYPPVEGGDRAVIIAGGGIPLPIDEIRGSAPGNGGNENENENENENDNED